MNKSEFIRVYNCSKQMIALQVRPPGSDFYTNEQQVRLFPGKDVLLPKSHLILEQISNLKAKNKIQVVYDSSTVTA